MRWFESTRVRAATYWSAFVLATWIVLRPALTISIVYDDFYNPVRLRVLLGSNPVHIVVETVRELSRNGHFNYFGQSIGALIYVAWDQLMSWGVRYSLIYSMTKLVVFIAVAVAGARLLRTLVALLGRELSPWRSRLVVAVALFATVQIHVPWSYDPVGNFPLWGYLSAAIGVLAADLAIRTLSGASSARVGWSALALCAAILYYEINVAAVCAIVPIVVLLHRRCGGDRVARRRLWRRATQIVVPPALMTIALTVLAAHQNTGYEGTQAGVGAGGIRQVVEVVGGSLPGVAWPRARDWYGGPFQLVVGAIVGFVIVAVTLLALNSRRTESQVRVPWIDAVLVACSMLAVWLAASLVQGFTVKVNAQTDGFASVYTYYAYGSLALPMAAYVLCLPLRTARWSSVARPALLAGALAFSFVQLTINEDIQRRFDEQFPGISSVLAAYSDQPSEEARCASLALFLDARPWSSYYPSFPRDLDISYREHHGAGFCESLIPP